jgi:cbb3-type cytochrome oxidase subunit 3
MFNPIRVVWELIEFGIQALFVYVLVIIIFIGIIATILYKEKNKEQDWNKAIKKAKIDYIQECTRVDGCRIRKDGTIEW